MLLAKLLHLLGLHDQRGAKACPFCGEKSPQLTLTTFTENNTAQVNCRNCFAAGPAIIVDYNKKGDPGAEAVRRWNKR